MGDFDPIIQADNTRCALERVGRTHTGFQLPAMAGVTLQYQQAGIEHLGLGIGLHAVELQQRGIPHLIGRHAKLLLMACRSNSSSSWVMLRPCHCTTPLAN